MNGADEEGAVFEVKQKFRQNNSNLILKFSARSY